MITEVDVKMPDGRTVHAYDAPPDGGPARLTVVWHHGTPNVGAPPEPLFAAAAERGIRWVSYDRPAYGGSSPHPGRDVSSAAADVAAVTDALGIDRFAVMGHSGGSTHALACGAVLPDRVLGVVCVAGLAPLRAAGLDWFAGMGPAGAAELRAAVAGREQLEALLAVTDFDPEQFTAADYATLAGDWAWLGGVAGAAMAAGTAGMVDDDLAYVAPWGSVAGPLRPPVLLVYGEDDRIVPPSHGRWLATRNPSAQLWLRPGDGHLSVLGSAVAALDWLVDRTVG